MADTQNRGPAVLALGFRPFYLLAAIFAVVGILLWTLVLHGVTIDSEYLAGLAWHSHEMLFGFVAAVMAGFLLTAVRNWTGLPTPTGKSLGALAMLWLAGRVLAFTGPGTLAVLIDILFLPALAIAVGIPIVRSRNRRNYKVLLILVALVVANVSFHYSHSNAAVVFGNHVMMILLAIVGGRVIPAFTANAVPGATPGRNVAVDFVAMGALVAAAGILVIELGTALPAWMATGVYAVGALAHAIRLLLWQPLKTASNPLLWMLPAAYAWIPVALLLAAVSSAASTHAMTVGAMSSMMMAMMMRSSLGHTGRLLAASRLDITAFLVLQLAAIARVGATLLPGLHGTLVAVSGAAWILAFTLYLVHYGPILIRPRVDGRAG